MPKVIVPSLNKRASSSHECVCHSVLPIRDYIKVVSSEGARQNMRTIGRGDPSCGLCTHLREVMSAEMEIRRMVTTGMKSTLSRVTDNKTNQSNANGMYGGATHTMDSMRSNRTQLVEIRSIASDINKCADVQTEGGNRRINGCGGILIQHPVSNGHQVNRLEVGVPVNGHMKSSWMC